MPPQPYTYHLAEEVNRQSIEQRGLLSTTALLDLGGICGTERERIERQHRLACVKPPNGILIRHQRPMPPKALERCLIGMTSEEWYVLLNSKVFFWFDIERLNRQRLACGPLPQVVMVIDTTRLIAKHAERISLTPINTGNARR